jgi:hypothetical protein
MASSLRRQNSNSQDIEELPPPTNLTRAVTSNGRYEGAEEDEDDDMVGEMPNIEKLPTFDSSKSSSSAETVVDFLEGFNWTTSKLTDVPGIGPATETRLSDKGITTVQQLLGVYMGFVEPGAAPNEINNKFFGYIKETAPKANAHTVTFSIAHIADKYGIVLYEE